MRVYRESSIYTLKTIPAAPGNENLCPENNTTSPEMPLEIYFWPGTYGHTPNLQTIFRPHSDIVGVRSQSPRSKSPQSKSPGQNPPSQNTPSENPPGQNPPVKITPDLFSN